MRTQMECSKSTKKVMRLLLAIIMILLVHLSAIDSYAENAKQIKGLRVSKTNITLNVGENFTPDVTVTPAEAGNKNYVLRSSDNSVVIVDGHKIRAVGGGKATVEIAASDGSKAKTKFTVYVPSLVGKTQKELMLNTLGNKRIELSFYGKDSRNIQIQVSAKNIINVTYSLHGTNLTLEVSPIKPGKSRITVKDKTDGKSAQNYEITVGSGAIPNARKIIINNVRQSGSRINIGLTNQSGYGIKAVYFSILLYDESGRLLMPMDRGPGKWHDFSQSVNVYDVAWTNHALKKGNGTGNVSLYLDEAIRSRKFSRIEVAVIGYEPAIQTDYTDADPIGIPESQWTWYSTKEKGYINSPSVNKNYHAPVYSDSSLFSIYTELHTESYMGGIQGYYLNNKYARAYGFHHSGLWITKIRDSWKTLYPIQVGDLLWGINDINYIDEPYLENKFSYELYKDDQTVVLHMERKGKNYDVSVNPKDYYSSYNNQIYYFDAENRGLVTDKLDVSQQFNSTEQEQSNSEDNLQESEESATFSVTQAASMGTEKIPSDLSDLTSEKLLALIKQVNRALETSEEWEGVKVPQGVWKVGTDIPAGTWTVKCAEGGNRCEISWGDTLEKDGESIDMTDHASIYNYIYNPESSYYKAGEHKTEYSFTVKADDYIVVHMNESASYFTTYIGKPSMEFIPSEDKKQRSNSDALFDLSGKSFAELMALKEQINMPLWNSENWKGVIVPQGVWKVGTDIPAGTWTVKCAEGGNRCEISWGDTLKPNAESIDKNDYGSIYNYIYNPQGSYYKAGEHLTEYSFTVKEGDYIVVHINESAAYFTPYAGKPSLGFK